MKLVQLVVYKDFGQKTFKTIHNVIPTSIRTGYSKDVFEQRKMRVYYYIYQGNRTTTFSWTDLKYGMQFSICPNDMEI